MTHQTVVLEAANVVQVYPGRPPYQALTDVSLALHERETLALVGESGSGKTTLTRLLLGLAQPSAGQIACFGAPLSDMPRKERATMIQPVFQDPFASLNPNQSLGQIIAAPLLARGQSLKTALPEACALLEEVGLPGDYIRRTPAALSGGQRQRVAIARALIAKPRILICDEPTSALDVSVQAQILQLLTRLRKDHNLSMLIVTHNIGVVAHLADRVAVMRHGQIVETGTTEQVLLAPRHDYTRALLSAVLSLEPATPRAPRTTQPIPTE